MIVGGNIDHLTRVMTTAIALETGKGNFALALGLGFVLIALSITVNLAIHWLSRTETGGPLVSALLPMRATGACVHRRGKRLIGPIDLVLDGQGITALIGPNVAGKSTLLEALHGLERLSAGRIEWACPEQHAQQRQAFVFQTPVMLRRSVLDNLVYPLRLVYPPPRAAAREAEAEWCERIGLAGLEGRPATVLSGGEKQKLALARALITQPEMLFLDEPSASLGGRATRAIEAFLMLATGAGTRIVMATHDMGQARRLAREVVFLRRGEVHEVAAATSLFDAPSTDASTAFLASDIVDRSPEDTE